MLQALRLVGSGREKERTRSWTRNSKRRRPISRIEAVVQPQDGFLFIGELAKLTGTDPKTIRFYERAELISPPRHGRFRTYLASDVRRLKNVLILRKLGVPIAQIRQILGVIAVGHRCPRQRQGREHASPPSRDACAKSRLNSAIRSSRPVRHSTGWSLSKTPRFARTGALHLQLPVLIRRCRQMSPRRRDAPSSSAACSRLPDRVPTGSMAPPLRRRASARMGDTSVMKACLTVR